MISLTAADLSNTGLLWYINRVALHPRGFALSVEIDSENPNAATASFALHGNGLEPMAFAPTTDDEKFAAVNSFFTDAARSLTDDI